MTQPETPEQNEANTAANLIRFGLKETERIEKLLEIQEKLQRALQECRDALEEAARWHHPRFDRRRMQDVRVEAVNALALVQKSGERHDDNRPLEILK